MKVMTELRVCSKCTKAFYTKGSEYSPPCSFCGYVMIERLIARIPVDKDFSFELGGEKRVATLKDYSSSGARIEYLGGLLPPNVSFICKVKELQIDGIVETVWSKVVNQASIATGVRFLFKYH